MHIGGGFAGIISASTSIEKVATTYHIEGSVSMTAFQIGGDPA